MATHLSLPEADTESWLQEFKANWHQGDHVGLLGPTGTGKTTIALSLLEAREHVVAIAVKRKDATLDLFKKEGYTVIQKWPPPYNVKKVIFWKKPASLTDDLGRQAQAIHDMLNKIYLAGGWCVYFDEAGYIAGVLGLSKDLGVLLNQGRSAFLSIVVVMTRPSSMVARVPKEALNQPRHKLVFKFRDEREVKAAAEIVGIHWKVMLDIQRMLGRHDFVYVGEDSQIIVRNTKGK